MVLTIKFNLRERRNQNVEEEETQDEDAPCNSRDKSSSNRYARTHREKLKSDPAAWAKHKEKERERHRERRARRTEEQMSCDREASRLRQQRYAARRKSLGDLPGSEHTKKAKILTRSERLKKAEYNKIKQRESRASLTPQQKRRRREKDARSKREKRKAEKKKRKRNRKETRPDHQPSRFPTATAKRMAVSRLWEKVPEDPEKFSEIIEDFLGGSRTTPRKRAALERRGILPATKKTRLFQKVMSDSVRQNVLQLKRKKDKTSARDRRLLVSAHMICKKYRMQSILAKQLDMRPSYLGSLSKAMEDNTGTWMTTRRERRSDATSLELIEQAQQFYRSPKVSRELPYMKTVKKQVQRRVMEVSISQAYKMYKEDIGDDGIIGLSSFQRMRPNDVLLQQNTKLNQCLCESCTNIFLKLQALNRAAQTYSFPEMKVRDKYKLIALSKCPNDGKYGKIDCINRDCSDCGVSQLQDRFAKLEAEHGESMIHWLKWIDQKYDHNGKTQSKKVMTNQRATLRELLRELLEETETLAKHLFVANWQQDQFTNLSKNLPKNWALLVLDFAENYSCLSQDEIQSAHWAIQQVTVHPIVAYYNCEHPDPAKSHIAQEAMVFISDDLVHDYHAVHHFEKEAIRHLREERGLHLNYCVQFTDGCAAQYKTRGPFADISFAKVDHGIGFERAYFGSRHGKGPSDGVSGVTKSAVRRAVISRRAVVNTAEDMFSYCKENMSLESCDKQQRSFFFVQKGGVERERPKREVKAAVSGTRSFHSVKCVEPGVVDTRPISCFCDGCWSSPPGDCTSGAYSAPWMRHTLKMVTKPSNDGMLVGDFRQVLNELEGEDEGPLHLDISLTEILETMSVTPDQANDNDKGENERQEPVDLQPEVLDTCLSMNKMIKSIVPDGLPSQQGATNSSGATNSPGTSLGASQNDININSYAAIRFEPVKRSSKAQIYMAMITERSNGFVRVKFMRQQKRGYYTFTEEEESTHPVKDIQQHMGRPVLVAQGRAYLYKFKLVELEILAKEFELK